MYFISQEFKNWRKELEYFKLDRGWIYIFVGSRWEANLK